MARLSRFHPFHRFTSQRLCLRGIIDGRAGIPAYTAQAQPPVLEEVREAGSNDAALAVIRWTKLDERLRARWAEAHLAHAQARAAEARTYQMYEAARTAYAEANGEAAPATADRRTFVYLVVMAVFAIVEFPINAAAFVALGEAGPAQWSLAALAGMGLLWGAHVAGEKLRQVGKWTWQEMLITAGSVLGPAAVIASVGYFRRLATGLHEADLLRAGITLDPAAVTAAFIAFNVCAFVVGAALSYRAHPAGWGELNRTRRLHQDARRQAERTERVVEATRVARQEAFDAACAEVAHLQEAIDMLAERYRQANLLHRRDRDAHEAPYPASFHRQLVIEAPKALERLDWSLPTGAPLEATQEATRKAVQEAVPVADRAVSVANEAVFTGDGAATSSDRSPSLD